MTLLEKKVDAIARALLANDMTNRNQTLGELSVLMQQVPKRYENAEAAARAALFELGVPEHIKGYRYLLRALMFAVEDANAVEYVTGYLYPKVAEVFDTTGPRVERAIRHGIELAWDRGDLDVLYRYFGNTTSPSRGRPTNAEFIARVANVVRMRMEDM